MISVCLSLVHRGGLLRLPSGSRPCGLWHNWAFSTVRGSRLHGVYRRDRARRHCSLRRALVRDSENRRLRISACTRARLAGRGGGGRCNRTARLLSMRSFQVRYGKGTGCERVPSRDGTGAEANTSQRSVL